MGLEDADVVLGLLEMMRGERHRQHRHAALQPGLHQPGDDRLGDEVVPVDAAVDDEGGAGDRRIAPGLREIAGEQRHLEGARGIEHVDVGGGDDLAEPFQGLIDDFGMPVGFDEGVTGGRHVNSSRDDTSPRAITCALPVAGCRPDAPSMRHGGRAPPADHTFSSIRTVTVGSGIAPDLLTLPGGGCREGARGLASLLTAGGEFRPALRTARVSPLRRGSAIVLRAGTRQRGRPQAAERSSATSQA